MTLTARSRALDVVQYIESLVQRDNLRPGDGIATKDQVREASGAARATVNEAVKILLERGRVTMRPGPNGGLFLADADPGLQVGRFLLAVGTDAQSVADAIAVRDHLEFMMISEALTHRTENDLTDLWRIIEQLRRVAFDESLIIESIWELHMRIGRITPNIILSSTYRGLVSYIRDNVAGKANPAVALTPDYAARRVEIHAELVELIDSQDTSYLAQMVDRHNHS